MRAGAARRRDLSMNGHSPCSQNWMDPRCVNGPQTQRPLHPAAQVLGGLFKCERTQISRPFVPSKFTQRRNGRREGLKRWSLSSRS